MEKKKILITDDEKDIRNMVKVMLAKEGFLTVTAHNGRAAIEKIKEDSGFHLIIMDIIMPEMDGIQTVEEIRKITDCPILFLTAKSADEDKINAYGSGGDDYLVKPFSRVELILRVKALLKRHGKEEKNISGISLNVSRRILEKNGQRIQLTEKEFDLLNYLYQNKGITFSSEELYEQIWKEEVLPSSSNTVMVHILKIRKKLEEDYTHPKYIQTVWGKGYCYVEPEV